MLFQHKGIAHAAGTADVQLASTLRCRFTLASNNYLKLTLGQRPAILLNEIIKPINKRFILNVDGVASQMATSKIKLSKARIVIMQPIKEGMF